jgi:hypothetical protein
MTRVVGQNKVAICKMKKGDNKLHDRVLDHAQSYFDGSTWFYAWRTVISTVGKVATKSLVGPIP